MDDGDTTLLRSILERLESLEARIEKMSVSPPNEEGLDRDFERRRIRFVASMTALSAFSTYVTYTHFLPLFSVFFGLFFVFLILIVGLVIDEYVLPAPTFRRISTNAIAVALFWISIVYLAVSGVGIGTSIISDPFTGSEGRGDPPIVEVRGEG